MEEGNNEGNALGSRSGEWGALLERISAGDGPALLELYDRTGNLIYGLIQRALPKTGAAEEVLLLCFTNIWNHAREYAPDSGDPLAWILAQARTCTIERVRADRPDLLLEGLAPPDQGDSDPGAEPAPSVAPERQRRAREALQSIPPEERRALELALFSGMGHGEIALKTGQPIRLVRARTRQAMIRLSDALQDLVSRADWPKGQNGEDPR
jgi:RNA polymerase sigma-70 factor, ECF subfamily